MPTSLTVGLGAASLGDADLVLDLAPQHPSAHGALRLALTLEGPRILTAEPIVGFMHRGAEKLFEVRDYRQILVLANRHDWLSAFSNELGIALAVERMMALKVPERATWLRTLFAELNRVLNHTMFFSGLAVGPAAGAALAAVQERREALQDAMEAATGGRLHYMFNQIGGLKQELPGGWTQWCERASADLRAAVETADQALTADGFFARAEGLGVIHQGTIEAYGVTGPAARAAGYDMDLRRDEPYLAYADLAFGTAFPVPVGSAGDAAARFRVLLDSIAVSLDLVDACLARAPGGPISVRLPKSVRAPEGSTYCWTENPLGVMGYYLVSRGEKTPWRLAMRTASFNNVSALAAVLPGTALSDLVTVLTSMFFVVGDIDK
ncbi:MAG TPA: hypothetical protein VNA30_06755 [Mycobacteriales bacterium]|nr:hypothetical protein [Mycobacteriales bacterium]